MPWLALAAFIAVADQSSKHAIGASLRPGEVREITGFFNLVLAYNRGAAFSFLSDAGGWQRVLFIVIAAVAVAVIVALLARHPGERLFCAFNVADSAITVGAGLLILDALRSAGTGQKP